jgi:hypothetical protein
MVPNKFITKSATGIILVGLLYEFDDLDFDLQLWPLIVVDRVVIMT